MRFFSTILKFSDIRLTIPHIIFLYAIMFGVINVSPAIAQMEQRENNRDDYVYKSEMDVEPDVRMTRCQRLEQRLANVYIRSNSNAGFEQAAELTKKIEEEGKRYKSLQRKADRGNCYEDAFLFGKTLRRTRKCISLDRKIRRAKNTLHRLDDDRANLRRPRNNEAKRDALLDELARNRCGKRYEQSRRSNSFGSAIFGDGGFLGDDDSYSSRRRNTAPDQIKSYATYRTMCVRLCDGFYFPVSFSALPSKFEADSMACQDRCAAPTQLFVYRNPGAEIEQMIDSVEHLPYSKLPNAWKFKKSFVQGCSCKQAEYKPVGEGDVTIAQQGGASSPEAASDSPQTGNQTSTTIKDSTGSGFETTVKSEPLDALKP